jgi:YVTN family beta-propeller protein
MSPFVCVANSGAGTVSVLDTATSTVVATIPVDGAPVGVAITPDASRAYVTTRRVQVGGLSVIDIATKNVTAKLGLTDFFIAGITLSPDGGCAYIANSGNNHVVTVLDTATNTVSARIALPESIDLAVSPDGKWLYVTHFDGVTVVDTATNQIDTDIDVGKGTTATVGRGIAFSPDGHAAFLTTGGSNSVAVIDAATRAVIATIDVGADPVGIAAHTADGRVYVTNHGAGTVSVIDTATASVVSTIRVGDGPVGVTVTADGSRVLVANLNSDTVSVIDTATDALVGDIATGLRPFHLAASPR